MREVSALERVRLGYEPRLPEVLARGIGSLGLEETARPDGSGAAGEIRERFPRTVDSPSLRLVPGSGPGVQRGLRVGVVLSGGQAPGGHNVIAGLLDGILDAHPDSRLFGFLNGPRGVLRGQVLELAPETVAPYRNTGGFDLLGSGRDKIETEEQFEAAAAVCRDRELDALVIVGGDDSNTNAAVLAEYFLAHDLPASVLGVPKTIDGDMRGGDVEMSFGFDTATKLFSELIGNICRDAASARKYWHFVKLMGRNASHVTLECALQTHANVSLIGEEVAARNTTLRQIVTHLAEVVRGRAEQGRTYGVCLVPEGLIEFIPEVRVLIAELNAILAKHEKYFLTLRNFPDQQEFVNQHLSVASSYVFSGLPARIQLQLLMDRDAHGNVQVSMIETEKLLIEEVGELLDQWKVEGEFTSPFRAQSHFLGYEGRCAAPTNFDADYTYTLGWTAAALAAFRRTGYVCFVHGLTGPPADRRPGGMPICALMGVETRRGRSVPVVRKALVDLDSPAFRTFDRMRRDWEMKDAYAYPGAIQYFGPAEVCDRPPKTLELDLGD